MSQTPQPFSLPNLASQAPQQASLEKEIGVLSTQITAIDAKLAKIEEKLDQSWFDKILSLAKSSDVWQKVIFVFLVVWVPIAIVWVLKSIPYDVLNRILGLVQHP